MFKTIEGEAEGIVIEKKSKFISNIYYVESEEEAEEILKQIKKKYYDARHHCFAYRVMKEKQIISRQSDDGEPSGTAGAPMLNILEKNEFVNVLLVVTRYFGGILLGTGGLVKAYSDSSKDAIKNCKVVMKEEGYIVEIKLDYNDGSDFEHICRQNNFYIVEKEYTERVKYVIEMTKEKYEKIVEEKLSKKYQKMEINIKNEQYIKI